MRALLRAFLLSPLLAVLLAATPAPADDLDIFLDADDETAIDDLLAEPATTPPLLPEWLDLRIDAAAAPVLGEPFALTVTLTPSLADLAVTVTVRAPRGVSWVTPPPRDPIAAPRDRPTTIPLVLVLNEPVTIVDGRLEVTAVAEPPRSALDAEIRRHAALGDLTPSVAAKLQTRAGALSARDGIRTARILFCVREEEGFLGFTPLVWGRYLASPDGDTGFFLGSGNYLDADFDLQDQVRSGQTALREDRVDAAAALFEAARLRLRTLPGHDALLEFEAANGLAVARCLQGRHDEGRRIWEDLVEAAPAGGPPPHLRYVHYNLGESLRAAGDAEGARAAFDRALSLKAAFTLARRKLALVGGR